MQKAGGEQETTYWLITYKDEEACRPLSALPLEDASVTLLYESDKPYIAEKSLLVRSPSHCATLDHKTSLDLCWQQFEFRSLKRLIDSITDLSMP